MSLLASLDRVRERRARLARVPTVLRPFGIVFLTFAHAFLILLLHLVSTPLYLSGSPQEAFARSARRSGQTYTESYAAFEAGMRWTIGVILTSILAILGAFFFAVVIPSLSLQSGEAPAMVRIGILSRATTLDPAIEGFAAALSDAGYQDGENVIYVRRYAGTDDALLARYAEDFAQRENLDLILALGGQAAEAAKQATEQHAVPVVFFTGADLVDAGLVANYASSGNNLVGVGGFSFVPRTLEILLELKPETRILGAIEFSNDPTSALYREQMEVAARDIGVSVLTAIVASADEAIASFQDFAARSIEAVYLTSSVSGNQHAAELADAALDQNILLFASAEHYTERNALFSYFVDLSSAGRQLAAIAEEILSGRTPGSLSSQLPEQTSFTFNRTTAANLGIALPPQLADEVDRFYD